jgi:hypothetical protein
MNAIPLFTKEGNATNVSYCSVCMMPKPHDAAETCCKRGVCKRCGGETQTVFNEKCFDCREKDQMDAAEKVEDWGGPVVHNDHYYESIDDLLESHDEGTLPEFVWIAETEHFPLLDVADILENFCSDLYEDAEDNLEGVEDLTKAVAAFNEANAKNTYWLESGKRATRVPQTSVDPSKAETR